MSLTATDRRILRLAAPAFGALAAEPLYRLVDTAIVGRLGKEQLGGVAIAISILSIVIAGSNFLAYGTTQRVANRLGADDPTGAANVGVQAFWLALFIGVTAAPLLAFFAEPLVSTLGASDEVLPLPRPTCGSRRSACRSCSWVSPRRAHNVGPATTDRR